ncbi:hypothetical protein Pint_34545 [Pistacia integerrima]|uniref:Uncharacterized protein n=1 Tax=Pistacia integerrima TaxID=434235 RepID=A0ACC0X9N6_9ROSI|nr:hypothetical protein Pint_34545 [Pistacia integerrima]
MMGKKSGYLVLRSEPVRRDLVSSDVQELLVAAKKLAIHAIKLGGLMGFGTSILEWIASFAAMGDISKWISFIVIVLRLFFPRHFPAWLEMPGALLLLIVVAPSLFADTLRDSWIGVTICLAIAFYLLQEHIRASGNLPAASALFEVCKSHELPKLLYSTCI